MFSPLSVKLMELVMVFFLKLVKRRKYGVKRFSVYLVTEHIHDDSFKFAVKAVKQLIGGPSAVRLFLRFPGIIGLGIGIEISELFPYLFVRAEVAVLFTITDL